MTPEQTFGQLLGLGKSWNVVESRFEAESSTFFLKVEETPELWPEESARAGTPVTCHHHVEPMRWRHLNVFNKECVIVCALPRGRRSDDSKVYRVTPPWEGRSKHFTQEFEAFALTLMREMPVKRAGQILGESDTRMWRMLFTHMKAAYERLSFENVVWVGADEMNRRKGHNYLTVFADLLAKRVIFATPGKDASVVTVRPSRMVEGLNGLDWEAGCTLGLTAVRTVSLVCSNRRGHPLPVGAATSAAALARLSRHPRGVSFQISRCGWLDNRGTMSHR